MQIPGWLCGMELDYHHCGWDKHYHADVVASLPKGGGGIRMNAREKQINLRLSNEGHDRLTKEAALKGIGRAAYLRMLLLKTWRKEDASKKNR